jgi:hypothetical protein
MTLPKGRADSAWEPSELGKFSISRCKFWSPFLLPLPLYYILPLSVFILQNVNGYVAPVLITMQPHGTDPMASTWRSPWRCQKFPFCPHHGVSITCARTYSWTSVFLIWTQWKVSHLQRVDQKGFCLQITSRRHQRLDYIASNGRMTDEWWTGKRNRRKWLWPNLANICLEALRKDNNWCLNRGSNQARPR